MVRIADTPWMLAEYVPTLAPNFAVAEAAKRLMATRVGFAVVVDSRQRVVGVLSRTDIVRAMADLPSHVAHLTIERVYTKDPVTCDVHDDAEAILRLMTERDIRYIPLLEGRRLKGLLSRENLKTFLAEAHPAPERPSDRPAPDIDLSKLDDPQPVEDIFEDDGIYPHGDIFGPGVREDGVDSVLHADDFKKQPYLVASGLVDYIPDSRVKDGKRAIPGFKLVVAILLLLVGLLGVAATILKSRGY